MKINRRGMAAKQERFETLLASHLGIIFRVVQTYCRHADDRQELAQEIKVQLWRAFGKYDERRSFSTWMYRIALNTAISWNRGAKLRNHPAIDSETAVQAEANEETIVLYGLIDELDPMNRAVLMLYLEDLSHAEIGEVLGISAANAATKISRIKQRLRQMANE